MQLKKCLFLIFIISLFQVPTFANSHEEVIFYEQLLNSYESNDMKKFYSLLNKFQKLYPDSSYKTPLFRLAAKNLFENKQYENALFFIERLNDNNRIELKSYQAECYLRLKQYDKVVSMYKNVLPKDLVSRQILASAFIGINSDKSADPAQRAEAATRAIEVLESQNLDALPEDTLMALSKLHFRTNQFKKSAQILKHLLKSETSNKEELLIHLSLVQKKYNPKLAIKTLDETLKLNGKLKGVAAYQKLIVLFENKQYKELISFRDSLNDHLNEEKLPLFHYCLGTAFLNNNEYSESEKEFNIFLENTSNFENLKIFAFENLKLISDKKKKFLSKDALSQLAKLYFQSKQYVKSARMLTEILRHDSSNKEEVLIELSLAQKHFDYKLALKTLNEAIKLNGEHKEMATYQKMAILFENMQYSALIASRRSLQKNLSAEKLPLMHYYLGVAFLKKEKYYDAEREFSSYLNNIKDYNEFKVAAIANLKEISEIKSKLKLNYKEIAAHRNMTNLFKSEKYSKLISTKEHFQKNLNPENLPLLHYFLGVAFLKKDNLVEAEKEFNAYLADIKGHIKFETLALENLKTIKDQKVQQKVTHLELTSYKKMIALFNKKKYKDLISYKDKLQSSLNKKDLPLLHYFLGVAFLKNNEYAESEKAFNIYLSNTLNHKNLKLNALTHLKGIAIKKDDTTLLSNVETSIAKLKDELSINVFNKNTTEKSNYVDFSAAIALKRDKKFNEAKKALKALLKTEQLEKGAIYFELAHIYYLESKYINAKNLFRSFIKNNANSALVPLAWNYYIEASINLTKSEDKYAKAHLMHDIKTCLKSNRYLSQLERTELMFLLAKTQYELTSFEEAIGTINTLIRSKRIEKDVLAKCYLVLAYSYKNGLGDNESFVFYIKKATEIDQSLTKNKKIQALLESFSSNKAKNAEACAS